ncbi:MAG: BNR-4 repeat-containing protein [Armatimonadota bacterium]|nr:BNR-4 repeat-containing protein [Armatimonadota bacterium]
MVEDSGAQPEEPARAAGEEVTMAKRDFHPLIGGCGGVYLLAEPGELVVEVQKRDRNQRERTTELRAILAGPDRHVLQEAFIPDDGRPAGGGLGPPQTVRLTAQVHRPGIYALNITVSRDRYGQNMVWGFRTNCPRYLIETARGHKDERHQEPIVLESPDGPGVVCFHPRQGEFGIELSGLPAGSEPATVHDADGERLAVLDVGEDGSAAWTAPAEEHRDSIPWELRLPAAKATISIDSVTRWDDAEPIYNACYWSPDRQSWFPFIENRWLLTPYRRVIYAQPGAEGEVVLQVHNNALRERDFTLSVEFPDREWPVELDQSEVSLSPRDAAPVSVRYRAPDGDGPHVCHVRVTPHDTPSVSTYSTITLKPGEAPATGPLEMPIQLRPYEHENEQFGYLPDYPVNNQPYFDPVNRPYMRTGGGLATWRDGRWAETEMQSAVTSRPEAFEGSAVGLASTKVAFDRDGDLYLPAVCAGSNTLLHSADGGRTFAAYEVPGQRGTIDIEQFSGHNVPEGPPPLVRFRRTARDPNLRWRSINDLELFVPRKVDGRIEIGEPILITRQCIGLSAHSGIPSSVVSRGPKVHVAWGEATDPAGDAPGVPTFVVTYDRQTGELGEPALLGYGPPPNDVHNSPSITMDSEGYLHVLIGTHGRPFQYCRSQAPNDASSGWTEPVTAGEGLNQTYIGLVCGEDDALHVVFRLWRSGEPFPNSTHATLAYQRKRPGQPWEPPRVLVVAPFSEYSIFYHRLTVDHSGRLFISYDYWSTHWFYRNDHFGNRRALLMSPDGGETWKLAETRDLTR